MENDMRLFIDTWGWVTIHNKREPRHKEVKRFYDDFRNQRGIAYTTDYILDETFTLFFKRLRLKFQDKPRISFTDLTSMVVMKELRIADILTGDTHFVQVGMGFVTVP